MSLISSIAGTIGDAAGSAVRGAEDLVHGAADAAADAANDVLHDAAKLANEGFDGIAHATAAAGTFGAATLVLGPALGPLAAGGVLALGSPPDNAQPAPANGSGRRKTKIRSRRTSRRR